MELVKQAYLKGERALFKSHDLKVEDSVFADGESPLKESDHLDISGSIFKWKSFMVLQPCEFKKQYLT